LVTEIFNARLILKKSIYRYFRQYTTIIV